MKVAVYGLWHLGSVTAACLANAGHEVVGLDPDPTNVANLGKGTPPLFEPGLNDLIRRGVERGSLRFTSNPAEALTRVDVLWVTFDTPVDDNDVADVEYVVGRVRTLLSLLPHDCLVLISSQLPVGTTRRLAREHQTLRRRERVTFAYTPENLRLGKAIQVFTSPERVVVGLESGQDKDKVCTLLHPFTDNIVWMSIESAEMTKHALNAFLATSVTFANEIAAVCEQVGADAKEVEQGLKSEPRIGPWAYLSPGAAFAGGTLARDIAFLSQIGHHKNLPLELIPSVKTSNDRHRAWAVRRLREILGGIRGKNIAILGLTYKPGTDTLRRSSAIELGLRLAEEGAMVNAFDPAVKELPQELRSKIALCSSAAKATKGASAVVVATEWPEFKKLDWTSLLDEMSRRVVIDANRYVFDLVQGLPSIEYAAVGRGSAET